MRITCEKCQAVYLIAEKIIGSSGRTVKCAKCSHCWIVKSIQNNNTNYTPSFAFLKSQKSTRILNFTIPVLILINLLLIFSFWSDYFIEVKPFEKMYRIFSVHNNKNISLEQFKLKKQNNDLFISGKITNVSSDEKEFPLIRYTIFDLEHNIIMRFTASYNDRKMKANQSLPINTKIANAGENAYYFQIDIGNKLDLLIR